MHNLDAILIGQKGFFPIDTANDRAVDFNRNTCDWQLEEYY